MLARAIASASAPPSAALPSVLSVSCLLGTLSRFACRPCYSGPSRRTTHKMPALRSITSSSMHLEQFPASLTRRPRVFLLDDEPEVRAQVAALLGSQGWNVVGEAGSEFAAASWLLVNRGGWELAVMDVGLQHGSGMNSVTRFVKDGSGAVVIYTTYVSEAVRETGRLLGARATISKRNPDELEKIARALMTDL